MTDEAPTLEQVRDKIVSLATRSFPEGSVEATYLATETEHWFYKYVIAERRRVAQAATSRERERIIGILQAERAAGSLDTYDLNNLTPETEDPQDLS